MTIVASGGLLVGDFGKNVSTGFPTGTTGFIAVAIPSLDINLATLNGAIFILADSIPTNASTANMSGPFVNAGVLAEGNVYIYGGCGNNSASAARYPTLGNTPSRVGSYVWGADTDPKGATFFVYQVPSSCGIGGTFKMFMGQLANGKLIGLPVYDHANGNTGAPILIQE